MHCHGSRGWEGTRAPTRRRPSPPRSTCSVVGHSLIGKLACLHTEGSASCGMQPASAAGEAAHVWCALAAGTRPRDTGRSSCCTCCLRAAAAERLASVCCRRRRCSRSCSLSWCMRSSWLCQSAAGWERACSARAMDISTGSLWAADSSRSVCSRLQPGGGADKPAAGQHKDGVQAPGKEQAGRQAGRALLALPVACGSLRGLGSSPQAVSHCGAHHTYILVLHCLVPAAGQQPRVSLGIPHSQLQAEEGGWQR